MRRLFVLRGVQGSGKSTLVADLLVAFPRAVVVSADLYWIDLLTGKYEFNRDRLGMAHEWAFNQFKAAVAADTDTLILDNTNIRVAHFEKYVDHAKHYGYTAVVMHIDTPESADTLADRNVHGVDAGLISRGLAQLDPWPQQKEES